MTLLGRFTICGGEWKTITFIFDRTLSQLLRIRVLQCIIPVISFLGLSTQYSKMWTTRESLWDNERDPEHYRKQKIKIRQRSNNGGHDQTLAITKTNNQQGSSDVKSKRSLIEHDLVRKITNTCLTNTNRTFAWGVTVTSLKIRWLPHVWVSN